MVVLQAVKGGTEDTSSLFNSRAGSTVQISIQADTRVGSLDSANDQESSMPASSTASHNGLRGKSPQRIRQSPADGSQVWAAVTWLSMTMIAALASARVVTQFCCVSCRQCITYRRVCHKEPCLRCIVWCRRHLLEQQQVHVTSQTLHGYTLFSFVS